MHWALTNQWKWGGIEPIISVQYSVRKREREREAINVTLKLTFDRFATFVRLAQFHGNRTFIGFEWIKLNTISQPRKVNSSFLKCSINVTIFSLFDELKTYFLFTIWLMSMEYVVRVSSSTVRTVQSVSV